MGILYGVDVCCGLKRIELFVAEAIQKAYNRGFSRFRGERNTIREWNP